MFRMVHLYVKLSSIKLTKFSARRLKFQAEKLNSLVIYLSLIHYYIMCKK